MRGGPTGWAIKRLLDTLGVACDAIAPSLVSVRPGDRVETDRRDTTKSLSHEDRWRPGVRVLTSFQGIRDADRAQSAGRDRRLQAVRIGAAADELSRADAIGVLQRRVPAPRTHHQGRAVHTRRRLIEAAWHYRHPPRQREAEAAARAAGDELAPLVAARAWQAQVRLNHRHRVLTRRPRQASDRPQLAVARELVGFPWAAMTDQPLREEAAHDTGHCHAARPANISVTSVDKQPHRPPGPRHQTATPRRAVKDTAARPAPLGPDGLPWTARRGLADDRGQAALTRTRRPRHQRPQTLSTPPDPA